MAISHEQAEKFLEGFSEFLNWYKALHAAALRDSIEGALDSTAKRIAYQLTAPDRASSEIAKVAERLGHGVSGRTIRVWQQEWVRLALVRQVSPQKRERVFDLESLGIDVGAPLSQFEELNADGGE